MRHDELKKYCALETLRNGTRVEIRALRPSDREGLLAAVGGTSDQSVYRRFFGLKREFSEREISRFLDIDFIEHVALVAVAGNEEEEIAAGARYVMVGAGQAEIACMVADRWQRQGLGKLMLRHLFDLAARSGLREMIAEVLPENLGMLKVFAGCGLPVRTRRDHGVVHVTIQLRTEVA